MPQFSLPSVSFPLLQKRSLFSKYRLNAIVAPRKSSRHFLRSWVMFSMAFFLSAVDFVIKAVIKAETMPINAAVISEFIFSIIIIYFLNFRGRASRGFGVGRVCHCVAGPQLGAVAASGLGPVGYRPWRLPTVSPGDNEPRTRSPCWSSSSGPHSRSRRTSPCSTRRS